MQIDKIQKYSYTQNSQKNQNFRARFDKASMDILLKEANFIKRTQPEVMPKLYTMLQYIDSLPGKVAKIVEEIVVLKDDPLFNNRFCNIVIDNKKTLKEEYIGQVVKRGYNPIDTLFAIDMLEDMCVYNKDVTNTSGYTRMPRKVFEQKWWENRHCNSKDILKYQY